LCRPDYLQLDLKVEGKGPVNNVPCGPSSAPASATYDSVYIYGTPIYGFGFAYDTVSSNSPMLYNDVKTAKYQFLIPKEELKQYGLYPGALRAMHFETARFTGDPTFEYSNFTISLKCTDKTSLSANAGFETGMIPVYTAPGATNFTDGWHKFTFDTPYDWDREKNLIVELCYSNNPAVVGACLPATGEPPIIKYMPTSYTSSLVLKPANATTTGVCDVTNNANIKEGIQRPVIRFDYTDAPALPFQYAWGPGNYLSDSTIKEPLAYVPKSVTYTVQTSGRSGCIVGDTLQVYVPVHDFSVYPRDTAICFGEAFKLEVRKGTYYQWYEYENGEYKPAIGSVSCDVCADPMVSPKKNTHYKIMVGDDVFCYDTIDAYVEVRPLPLVNILTPDTTIKYGQSVQLLVNGARLYNWSPVSSLNNPNISYPVATPTEPTMYVVTGLGTNGCRAMDTVRVNLDYRDRLLIPTAFSPNGDGKNDMFRIPNLTFQRVVEFRIFNRWGQEIFSGGDPKKGWDGNWKGVPQEIGSYQYMIRVAYPDGYVETYKGDVTLLR
jgi:gliding motility-associated-like protein